MWVTGLWVVIPQTWQVKVVDSGEICGKTAKTETRVICGDSRSFLISDTCCSSFRTRLSFRGRGLDRQLSPGVG